MTAGKHVNATQAAEHRDEPISGRRFSVRGSQFAREDLGALCL